MLEKSAENPSAMASAERNFWRAVFVLLVERSCRIIDLPDYCFIPKYLGIGIIGTRFSAGVRHIVAGGFGDPYYKASRRVSKQNSSKEIALPNISYEKCILVFNPIYLKLFLELLSCRVGIYKRQES
jgi:hypothetical protein